jgi:hypothetical protein
MGRSLANLERLPCVGILVEKGGPALRGAWFGVAAGILSPRQPQTSEFGPVVDSPPIRISLFACP